MKRIKSFKLFEEVAFDMEKYNKKSEPQLQNEKLREYDFLKNLLDKFSKQIDSKKLSALIISNKHLFMPYYNKYVENRVVNSDAIYRDLKRFNFPANESIFYGDEDFADDTDNNPILRFLYKFFIRWPKNLVRGIWEAFYLMVIDTWKDSKFISIMAAIIWIVTAIFVYLLGILTYSGIEHEINGLEKGKVTKEYFNPGHYETRIHHVSSGKSLITYTTQHWVPDTWYIDVVGEDNRQETWYTRNANVGKKIDIGDIVINDDDWTWGQTK